MTVVGAGVAHGAIIPAHCPPVRAMGGCSMPRMAGLRTLQKLTAGRLVDETGRTVRERLEYPCLAMSGAR